MLVQGVAGAHNIYLLLLGGKITQAHVFQLLLLFFEPRSGSSLFLLFQSRQFP